LIIPSSGGRTRNYTISYFGVRVLLFIFICIIIGTLWLIFEYGDICKRNLELRILKKKNQELEEKCQKLLVFEKEFNEFKQQTFKIANMLGVELTPVDSASKPATHFTLTDSPFKPKVGVELGSKEEIEALLEEEASEQRLIPSIYPVNGWVTRGFSSEHPGIDFAASEGIPVFSSMDGVVEFVGWDEALGNLIEITNIKGFKTVYGHLARSTVEKENQVRQGDLIGFVGSTGESSSPHLHYEVWLNGTPYNPENYLIK
ncbi:M23 family metallopeptidase, partial [candidate division WOR-3 bacterium]|nr:M23 family metallopeptidase [candidate division WOR-3 bacterium]